MARRGGIRVGWVWLVILVVTALLQFVNRTPPPDSAPSPGSTSSKAPVASVSVAPSSSVPSAPLPKAAAATHSVTATTLRVRGLPSTAAEVLTELPKGAKVTVLASSDGWGLVGLADGRQGWVSIDYLAALGATAAAPAAQQPVQLFSPPAKVKSKPPVRGTPLRGAYVGTCDCPYDRKRNGASCGGTSAYSRPGGRSPACYVGD